jgi:Flp pilus assembly protein TadG
MVEMALLAVVFLAVLFGIMDWSWTMYEHESLVSRATKAARWAAVRPFNGANNTSAQEIVLYGVTPCAGCTPSFGLAAANVTVQQDSGAYTVNGEAPVTTTHIVVTVHDYTVQHWFMGGSFAGRTITASALWECIDNTCNPT